jgi:hypothetical protein
MVIDEGLIGHEITGTETGIGLVTIRHRIVREKGRFSETGTMTGDGIR